MKPISRILFTAILATTGTIFLISLFLSGTTAKAQHQIPYVYPESIRLSGIVTPSVYLPIIQKPAPPVPAGQDVIFVSDRAEPEKYDIYSMDLQGNNVARLTNLGIDSYASFSHRFLPQWSPDGTRIAVQIDKAIYIMLPDGSQIEPLYDELNDAAVSIPAWSPDGSKIAFVAQNCLEPRPSCNITTGGGVRVIDVQTKAITQVIPDNISMDPFNDVAWTPDGLSVLAVPHEGYGGDDTGIIVGYIDGTPAKWILSGYFPEEFEISPNGQKIAFVKGDNVSAHTANIDGSNVNPVYSGLPDKFVYDVTWHPSGNRVAYAVGQSNGLNRTIFSANIDGSDAQDILPSNHSSSLWIWGWTPDGSRILFYSDKNRTYRQHDIFIVNGTGGNLTNLTANSPEDDVLADYRP